MTIPSGSGTEVLKRYANQVQNTTQTAFTVDTNHIITILSIHATVMGGSACGVSIYVHDGSADRSIIYNNSVPSYGTFVHNDKIVLTGGDSLKIQSHASEDVEYYVSYIEQDWS